ncbi:MAG: hypothetical protein WBV82_25860 [Myxococcaceae bacterium]
MRDEAIRLHDRAAFEGGATRAIAAGAVAGACHALALRLVPEVPLAWVAFVAIALSAARGDRTDRTLLSIGSLVLPSVPWLLRLENEGWTVALSAAAAGLVMVRGRLCERGEAGLVGAYRPGGAHWLAAAVTTGASGFIGTQVVDVLTTRLVEQVPILLVAIGSGAVLALFAVLGTLAAHVALYPDPVEARCQALLWGSSGACRELGSRALALYRECGAELAKLPKGSAHVELARTLSEVTVSIAELASEWSSVDASVGLGGPDALEAEIASLELDAHNSRDAQAKHHLETAAASLREELGHFEQHALHRERILSRLRLELTTLERARGALAGLRSGHAQLRATELAALARSFDELARHQRDEAQIAEEVFAGIHGTK